MSTRQIQQALKEKGFDPGPIDGVRGRLTIRAIMEFQRTNGLEEDGIVGPRTSAKLFGEGTPGREGPVSASEPWMIEGLRLIGIKEDTSSRSNPLIVGWGTSLRITYGNDEIPWCGLFVAHCIGSQMPAEPLANNPLGARNWAKFGVHCDPQFAAVMVFWRKSRSSGFGHVGFYVAEDDTAYHILGGNQADAVNVKRFSKDRFLEARWPRTAPPPSGRQRFANPSGRLSENEQ